MLSMWLQRVCQMGKTSQTKSTGLLAGVNNSKWTKALHKSKMSHPLVKAVFKALCSFRMLHLLIQINLMFFFCWYNSLVPHSACVISAVLFWFWYFNILQTAFQLKKNLLFYFLHFRRCLCTIHLLHQASLLGDLYIARGKESQISKKKKNPLLNVQFQESLVTLPRHATENQQTKSSWYIAGILGCNMC